MDIFRIINFAHAVKVTVCPDGGTACTSTDYSWGSYIEAIYGFSLKAGSILVVLMMIYAGYIYLTSQGESSKLSTAKDIIVGSLLGYVLLLTIYAVINYIGLPNSISLSSDSIKAGKTLKLSADFPEKKPDDYCYAYVGQGTGTYNLASKNQECQRLEWKTTTSTPEGSYTIIVTLEDMGNSFDKSKKSPQLSNVTSVQVTK